MKKKTILVLLPTERDKRELPRFENDYSFIFDTIENIDFDNATLFEKSDQFSDGPQLLEDIRSRYEGVQLDGIFSSNDYPGSVIAAILAQERQLLGPDPLAVLFCQHKYYSRITQQRHVWYATPRFVLVDPKNIDKELYSYEYPFFLKPVKAVMSMNAHQVNSYGEFLSLLKTSMMPKRYLEPFNYFISTYTPWKFGGNYLLAESLLRGEQCTLEGFVYNGEVHLVGIVDSIMFPGTLSFSRFEYPSTLPCSVQERMQTIAASYMRGIGYNNGFFNMEFKYDPAIDWIGIIEVNPRLCGQFADLYEKVDGFNTFELLLALLNGDRPEVTKKLGQFTNAASCVLRRFSDAQVIQIPSQKQLNEIANRFAGMRIEVMAQEGERLSDLKQDTASYRYCIFNIGGASHADLMQKKEAIETELQFTFQE